MDRELGGDPPRIRGAGGEAGVRRPGASVVESIDGTPSCLEGRDLTRHRCSPSADSVNDLAVCGGDAEERSPSDLWKEPFGQE